MMTTDDKQLNKRKIEGIRKMAHQNLRIIMKKFDFKGDDLGSRLVGCCPIPHGEGKTPNDNRKAFSWDFSRQMWQCFTHRCHQRYGSDVFALIQSVLNYNFKEAVQWVLTVTESSIDDVKEIDSAEAKRLDHMIKKRSELVKHKKMEEELMQHLKPSRYFKTRGFSDEVIAEFKCGGEWHKSGTYGHERVIVPVYDPIDGYLIAFTCRVLDDSQIEEWRPKWCHALNFADLCKKSSEKEENERFHASSVLFNLHRARNSMGDPRTIILVEGPGDVMKMWEAGIKNVAATLGTGFGKNHRTLLHKVGCQRVICVYDNDDAGRKAVSGVEKLCKDYFTFSSVTLKDGKDPGDHDPAQLRLIFKEYING